MKKVLVCKMALLPYSETFIKEQALAYSTWTPVMVGAYRIPSGLSLEGMDVRILQDWQPALLSRAVRRLFQEMRIPPLGAINRLKREAGSLIHVHFAIDAVAYWPLLRHLELPVVITLHGYDINIYRDTWERGWLPLFRKQYPRRLLDLATKNHVHFVAVSEAIKQRAIQYGISPDRINVCHIGIDLTKFRPAGRPICERRRRILFIGRLVEKKGGAFLIRAFARVRISVPHAELVMIGDGPLMSEHVNLADNLNIPVTFLGSLSSSKVKEQIDEARVLCLPSITAEDGDAEGFGIVILEAQASGVPVVTSARGGATEGILHGVTGFAVAEKDVASLSERLTELLLDDDLALSMSRAASTFVTEQFDIRRCTQALEALYDTVSSSHKNNPAT